MQLLKNAIETVQTLVNLASNFIHINFTVQNQNQLAESATLQSQFYIFVSNFIKIVVEILFKIAKSMRFNVH